MLVMAGQHPRSPGTQGGVRVETAPRLVGALLALGVAGGAAAGVLLACGMSPGISGGVLVLGGELVPAVADGGAAVLRCRRIA